MTRSLTPIDRLIFEGAHDAILIFDPDTEEVLEANRRAAAVYGMPRSDLLGLSLKTISTDVPRGESRIRETLAADRPVEFETIQRRADGSEMVLEIHASVVDYEGRRAILTINRDITERRAAERLRLEKEAAETAARATRELLAFFSHEIRNPLGAIVGLGQLLLDGRLEPRERRLVTTLGEACGALVETLDDVLELSRLDAGHADVLPEIVDLHRLVGLAVELTRPSAEAAGLRLLLHVEPSVPRRVRLDASRVRRVLLNLLGNAVKYTREGEVEFSLQVDGRSDSLVFTVRDTGRGIDPAQLEEVFEPFQRAAGVRELAGAGLGLAISRRLAEAMGGRVEVESEPERGSTFSLRLPLVEVVEEAPDESASPPPDDGGDSDESSDEIGASSPAAEPGPRILVVEDNPVNRMVLVEQLRFLGFEASTAASGEEAAERARSQSFTLVFLDCELPGIDGFETATRLREPELAGPDVRIVTLSGHSWRTVEERCRQAGVDDHLSKPFTPEELQGVLERQLTAMERR